MGMEVNVFNPELGARGRSISLSDLEASLGRDGMGTLSIPLQSNPLVCILTNGTSERPRVFDAKAWDKVHLEEFR